MIYIYSKPSCPNCELAKTFLKTKNIEFQETVLNTSETVQAFKANYPTVKSVPFILDDSRIIGTYSQLLLMYK